MVTGVIGPAQVVHAALAAAVCAVTTQLCFRHGNGPRDARVDGGDGAQLGDCSEGVGRALVDACVECAGRRGRKGGRGC